MEVIASCIPDAAPTVGDISLAESAVSALLQELEAYPKPGLVSRADSGAHADMDYDLMRHSSLALLGPFAKIAAAGRQARSFENDLIPLGIAAEREMLLVTGGVNTHRGAIFSLGMIVAALALLEAKSRPMISADLREALLETWGDALQSHVYSGECDASHGAFVRKATGAGGARVEATCGFPGIFEIGVPAYVEALASGLDANAIRIQTFFTIMEAVEDTNVIFRGGPEAASFVKQSAGKFLAEGGCHREGWFDRAEALHRLFIQRNLSPGGSADLLSGTLLVTSRCCQIEP